MIDHLSRAYEEGGPAEAPWWLEDAFYGNDDAEEAAWVAGLPSDVRAEYEAGPWTGAGESMAAGFLHHDHDGPAGTGFASGGAADAMPPGPVLARLTASAAAGGYPPLGESELIGVLCAWQRLTSWAQAGQAAAVIALAGRRADQSRRTGNPHLREHVSDEIAAALRLTGRGSGRLLEVAAGLGRLPEVLAALEAGTIDWAKACLFVDLLAGLPDEVARAIARRLLGLAGGMTSGQLRAALGRAVLAADPDAAERRMKEARKDARVEAWEEPSGNAALAGRELRPADVIAIDKQLTCLAEWLQSMGADGTISQLRAAAYTALLAGRELATLLPPVADPGPADPDRTDPGSADSDSADDPDGPDGGRGEGAGWPRLTGTVNLTMPLSAWAGLADAPGEVAGYGPAGAGTCRELAAMMGTGTRWCLTLTGPGGHAVAHGCARRPPPPGPGLIAWAAGLKDKLATLETGQCGHGRRSPGTFRRRAWST